MKYPRLASVTLCCMILLMSTAQLFFKQAGIYASNYQAWHQALALNPWLWIGLLASAVAMLCWLHTLRHMALSSAYPWTALIYVLTPLSSALLFGDQLSAHYLIGMTIIIAGVFLTAGGVRAP
jgi:drug/metabolite transporter (DMT)-like permease